MHLIFRYVGRRKFIFSTVNVDTSFLGALCSKIFSCVQSSKGAANHDFVVSGCQRMWDAIIEKKRDQIENIFRVNLPPSASIDVATFSEKFHEAALKHWNSFLKDEIERSQQDPFTLYSQINQSKLSRFGGSLTKSFASLTSKGSTKQQGSTMKTSSKPPIDLAVHHWVQGHIPLASENILTLQSHIAQLKRNLIEATPICEIENNCSCLLRERGLWGPMHASRLDKWQLDMTEGPCRMRKRMKQHSNFYTLYPYRLDTNKYNWSHCYIVQYFWPF